MYVKHMCTYTKKEKPLKVRHFCKSCSRNCQLPSDETRLERGFCPANSKHNQTPKEGGGGGGVGTSEKGGAYLCVCVYAVF